MPDSQIPNPTEQPAPIAPEPQNDAESHPEPNLAPPEVAPQPAQPPVQPKRRAAVGIGFVFSWVIFPLAAVFILHFFIFQAYHVVGTSMIHTLQPNDYLIISKVSDTFAEIKGDLTHNHTGYIPHRNQIIVFHYPEDPSLTFVKRVIGLPGDHLVIANGQVTIYNAQNTNGFDPNTGYEPAGTVTDGQVNQIVPAGEVFVLGDNRTPNGSFDSRDWGDLPSNDIIGNVVLRLLPLDQLRLF